MTVAASFYQSARPATEGVLFVADAVEYGACTHDEETSQVAVSGFGDPLASRRTIKRAFSFCSAANASDSVIGLALTPSRNGSHRLLDGQTNNEVGKRFDVAISAGLLQRGQIFASALYGDDGPDIAPRHQQIIH